MLRPRQILYISMVSSYNHAPYNIIIILFPVSIVFYAICKGSVRETGGMMGLNHTFPLWSVNGQNGQSKARKGMETHSPVHHCLHGFNISIVYDQESHSGLQWSVQSTVLIHQVYIEWDMAHCTLKGNEILGKKK